MTVRVIDHVDPLPLIYDEGESALVIGNGFAGRTITLQGATNSAPTSISLSSRVVDGDALVGTVVATLSGVDPDGDALDYHLISNPGGYFRIQGDKLLVDSVFTDRDADITITVSASDSHGASIDRTFVIEVDPDVISLPPIDFSDVISIPWEEFPEIVEDPLIIIAPLNPSDPISIPLEEFPEIVEEPEIAPTTVASLTLTGCKKADMLKGGAGDDLLNGGLGMDRLMGQEGADVFAFTTKFGPANVDWILDFQHAEDSISLSKAVFSKIQKGMLTKGAFCVGAQAHDRSDRIIYNDKTGALSYDADGSGAKYAAIKFAQLKPGTLLMADDIFIM